MRKRIIRASLAAAAAGATITTLGMAATGAASAAVAGRAMPSAVSGPVLASTSYSGYEASQRDFRYISATITVPNQFSFPGPNGEFAYPQEYVQLSNGSLANGDTEVRLGIEPCVVAQFLSPGLNCTNRNWVGFAEQFINDINFPVFTHFVPLDVNPGDGVGASIFLDQTGNEVHFVITPPTAQSCSTGPQGQCYFATEAEGPIYDHAAGLVDFTNSSGAPIPTPITEEHFRLTQFLQGALTTYTGVRGSWVGPWTTTLVEATSNGLQWPQGHVVVSPSQLWSDLLTANNAIRPLDAYGDWYRISG